MACYPIPHSILALYVWRARSSLGKRCLTRKADATVPYASMALSEVPLRAPTTGTTAEQFGDLLRAVPWF